VRIVRQCAVISIVVMSAGLSPARLIGQQRAARATRSAPVIVPFDTTMLASKRIPAAFVPAPVAALYRKSGS